MPKIENTKYERWYLSMIEKARSLRSLEPKIENTEKHHILPRCLKGLNIPDNLVRLSIREHYLAHLLLLKMYDGPEKYKLEWALFSLAGKPNRKLILTSRQFEKCRQTLHTSMKGRKQSKEHVEKRIVHIRGKGNGMHHSKGRIHPLLGKHFSEESKQKISETQKKRFADPDTIHPMSGKTHSDETKKKISLSNKGKIRTKEVKQRISEFRTGKKNTTDTLKKMSQSGSLNADWKITTPTGEELIIRGLTSFCRERGLNYTNLSYATRCHKPYQGYIVQKLEKSTP